MTTSSGPPQRLERRVGLAAKRANWKPIEELYPQVDEAIKSSSHADAGSPGLPESLVGALAVRLGRACANYSGKEAEFISDATAVLGQFHKGVNPEKLFDELYFDRRFGTLEAYRDDGLRRRRPTPFEAVVETARRLRDLAELRSAFQRAVIPSASVLGGSLSYGRFFNVRGGSLRNQESSDTDLLVVVPTWESVRRVPGILRKVSFLRGKDLDLMSSRVEAYEEVASSASDPMIFSHKISAWEDKSDKIFPGTKHWSQYGISFHVTSQAGFDRILSSHVPELRDDTKEGIFDFRTNVPADGIARGFDGVEERFSHTSFDHGANVVARFRVFDTSGGRYKPGLHQQLVLPNFESRWSSKDLDISMALLAFKWKLLERLRYERQVRPYRVQNLSLAHVRYHTFAPHVRRRTDALELEA